MSSLPKQICLPVLLAALTALGSCNQKPGQELDTPTTGHIKMVADESFMPLADAEQKAFHGIYKRARIDVSYLPETEAIKALLRDSARVILVSRELNANEKQVLEGQKLRPRMIKFANDGIAVILHPANPDSTFTVQQLHAVLTGQTTQWKQLDAKGAATDIRVVFDNKNSSTVRFLADSLLRGQALSKNAFAAESNPQVVAYVAEHPEAMGIIGLSWISDGDDSTSTNFLHRVKVAALAAQDSGAATTYVKPYQAFLATQEYPLRRPVYLITREARAGLGYGFMAYAASERGQRVVLKSGLLPATMPLRLVEIGKMSKLGR